MTAKTPFWLNAIAALLAGLLLWGIAAHLLGEAEPWDAPGYWITYGAALGLSLLAGLALGRPGWLWGLIIILAQLPVMMIGAEIGPLAVVGLLYAVVLAVPAMLMGMLGARFARGRG